MVSYARFLVPFFCLGIICISPGFGKEFIYTNNVQVVIQERAKQMLEMSDSVNFQEMVEMELSKPVVGTGMTEMELIEKLLNKKEEITSTLDEGDFLTCLNDLGQYLSDLGEGKIYAWQMRKSYGERLGFLTALFTWRLEYLGIYELCVNVKAENPDAPFETMQCMENLPLAGGAVTYKRGICVPVSCSSEHLTTLYNSGFEVLGLNLTGTEITCITDVPWEWDAIFVLCLLGFFGVLVLTGTIYDIAYRRRTLAVVVEATPVENEKPKENGKHDVTENGYNEADEEKKNVETLFNGDGPTKHQSQQQLYMTSAEEIDLEKEESEKRAETVKKESQSGGMLGDLLTSFSAVHNCSKILSAKKNSSTLSSLNGIRMLSMFWVIWGHCNQFFTMAGRLDDAKYALNTVLTKYWYNSLLSGSYSVDSFFVLSGLLVTYLTLKQLKANNGKMNWFLYYFHRFWRLTPVYMIAIGIYASLLVHMGKGANKQEMLAEEKQVCADYWWTNLLYFNNLYPFPGVLGGCMPWSWYLANDMQFFIVTPIFIILLYNRKTVKLGVASVIATCMASIIVTATLAGYYGEPVGKSTQFYNNRTSELPDGPMSDVTYGKPYCRIQSYMVGVFVGFLLYQHMHIKKIKMNWLAAVVGWTLAVGTMYSIVYAFHDTRNRDPLPQWFAAVWNGCSRTLFSMGVAWVAFACCTGYGGLINSFLSWSFWTPLARLNYCTYIIHLMIVSTFIQTKKVAFHWTFPEMLFLTSAVITISTVCALGLSLFIEAPTMGMEKVLLKKKKR